MGGIKLTYWPKMHITFYLIGLSQHLLVSFSDICALSLQWHDRTMLKPATRKALSSDLGTAIFLAEDWSRSG